MTLAAQNCYPLMQSKLSNQSIATVQVVKSFVQSQRLMLCFPPAGEQSPAEQHHVPLGRVLGDTVVYALSAQQEGNFVKRLVVCGPSVALGYLQVCTPREEKDSEPSHQQASMSSELLPASQPMSAIDTVEQLHVAEGFVQLHSSLLRELPCLTRCAPLWWPTPECQCCKSQMHTSGSARSAG